MFFYSFKKLSSYSRVTVVNSRLISLVFLSSLIGNVSSFPRLLGLWPVRFFIFEPVETWLCVTVFQLEKPKSHETILHFHGPMRINFLDIIRFFEYKE